MKTNASSANAQKKLTDERAKIRAVTYVRMSTEHQRYSIENQSATIDQYAKSHNMHVIRTYSDAGKSGLNISGRDGLKRLLIDVESPERDFDVVLVFDISRWGRFQDADEAAFYEYKCKRAGVTVHYCAEQFENDGSPVSTIVKGVKRAMAGEYSRELSAKVFAGQCRLTEKGFRQGGPAGFGLRRVLVDAHGNRKQVLERNQHKSLTTDRVILEPGPEDEVRIVNRIFQDFVMRGQKETEIAECLNAEGVKTSFGADWSRKAVSYVLQNEAYIGHIVYNRRSTKLRQRTVKNTPEMWVRADRAFEAIVSEKLFHAAQAILKERTHLITNEEILARLAQHFRIHGRLSVKILEEAEDLPHIRTITNRFGNLLRVYSLVGYEPEKDFRYLEIRERLRAIQTKIVSRLLSGIEKLGATVSLDATSQFLTINREFTVSICVVKHLATEGGASRWSVKFGAERRPDVTVAVRMNESNEAVRDYYFFPSMEFGAPKISLAERNPLDYDVFRFDNLSALFEMARRQRIYEAA